MKSLKRMCSEICYEKDYDALLWPSGVWDEKMRKIIDTM